MSIQSRRSAGLVRAALAVFLGVGLLSPVLGQTALNKRLAPDVQGSPPQLARVSPSVAERLARNEPVDVLILLDDRAEQKRLHSAIGPLSARPRLNATEYAAFLGTQQSLMRSLKEDVMLAAADHEVSTLSVYENLPVVHARIRSTRALERLRAQAKIRSIDEIVITRPTLMQSLPLIGQPAMESAGHTGAGTTVAVLDTGVDFSRAAFGACAAPGGSCKVVHAQDFATQDNSRDANGHGTNVAGIVLGVAPGARIAALDVFDGGGASSAVIINAINWCITNRAAYNIVAINMSLGGGRYYGALSPVDAWGSAITNAINAGIAVVAASGNDGYTDSMGVPAAYSNVISVGATYDASYGGIGFSRCSDASTAPWKITCFSNSASFLTMLAPGSQITAAGLTQSGTSQATPHVAGAVAVIKGRYPDETVAQVIARLKLGPTITDTRNNVSKPRLDLTTAMALPPTGYRLTVAKAGAGSGSVRSEPAGIDCGSSCAADFDTGSSVTLTALHGPQAMFAGWSGACAGSSTSCTVSMSAARSVTANFVPNTSEDFVPVDGLPAAWSQAAGSSAAWAPNTISRYVGTASLKAGSVADGQSSALEFRGRLRDGVISFARRVSSESGKDELRFYIDDELQDSWSGEVAWGMVAYRVTAGEHTLRWVYAKDASGAAGSDSAWIDSVNLPLAGSGTRAVASDFDGDGRSDIFWRNGTTGAHSLWLMNGGLRQSGSGAPPTLADPNWRIAGAADFDGDGKADILWRHATSGRNAIWFMDELERLSTTGETLAITDRNWQVAGTGDFDGDGKADILWRHATSGRNTVWLMDGLSRRAESTEILQLADLGWRVAAVADLDGDGRDDIVWRHSRDGRNVLWTMEGTTLRATGSLATVADARWRLVAAGDFDGNGKADLLWRNAATGGNALWLMDGSTRTNSVTTLPAIADVGWKVAGTGDYDGDGKADILWRHASRGQNSLWRMDGVLRLASYSLLTVADVRWGIASPRAGAH